MGNGMRKNRGMVLGLLALVVLGMVSAARAEVAVRDIVRLKGYGTEPIWGMGLVTGLNGTGDGGDVLAMARPLARLLENAGNPVPDLEEMEAAQSVAVVMITATLPENGIKQGDRYDVMVQTIFGASSLEGGQLIPSPMMGPIPTDKRVWAMASGGITLEGDVPTTGRVRLGARMIADIEKPVVSSAGTLTMYLNPEYAGWANASLIANQINQIFSVDFQAERERLAVVQDERTVMVKIRDFDLANPAGFISTVMKIRLDESLLDLPAKVVVNSARGSIVVTGAVTISPAVISHKNLVVTTVQPPIPITPENPRIEQGTFAGIDTTGDERGNAQVQDLLAALRQLDVSVQEQIDILKLLHSAGHLHAEFIEE